MTRQTHNTWPESGEVHEGINHRCRPFPMSTLCGEAAGGSNSILNKCQQCVFSSFHIPNITVFRGIG